MVRPTTGVVSPCPSHNDPAEVPAQGQRPSTAFKIIGTPWGVADHSREYAEGIVFCSTASHGGFRVSPDRFAQMHEALRDCASFEVPTDGLAWFEEDVDWCAVALAFPDLLSAEHLLSAERTLKDWRPDQWERLRGVKLRDEESSVLRERAFYRRHRNDLLVMSAWGSWAAGVPPGKVGVYAVRGGGRSERGSYWLVDAAEYQADRSIAFVIDPARHTSCPGAFDPSRCLGAA